MFKAPLEHESFEDPHKSLIAMIFVQAVIDARRLEKAGKVRIEDANSGPFSYFEILRFAGSDWAYYLADAVNLDIRDVWRWAESVAREVYRRGK